MNNKKLYILSADDDVDDQDFIDEALKITPFDHVFGRVPDGEKLLQFLNDLHRNNKEFPDVILLDLNMPIKSGRDAIKILKSEDSHFREIPVVILTTSNAAEDAKFCLQHGAELFLVKPTAFSDLVTILNKAISAICKRTLT